MNLIKYDPRKTQYYLILEQEGENLELNGILESCSWGDNEGDAIGKLEFTIAQTYLDKVKKNSDELIPNGSFVRLYADKQYINRYRVRRNNLDLSTSSRVVKISAYDRMYNFAECKESWYYAEGHTTENLMQDIFSRGETELVYQYPSTKHPAIITKNEAMLDEISDILDYAWTQVGNTKPVVVVSEGKTIITERGWNEYIYVFHAENMMVDDGNIIHFTRDASVEGITTRVLMLGKEVSENVFENFGGLDGHTEFDIFQEVLYADGEKTQWDIKREAKRILKEEGEQKIEYSIETPDVPHIRKGHKVKLEIADVLNDYFYVLSVTHDVVNRTMSMKLQPVDLNEKVDTSLTPEEERQEAEYKKKQEEEKNK